MTTAKTHKQLRIAMLSIHSSPLGPLGTRNTGGMSVYVRELTGWLSHQGYQVDIFTYVPGPGQPRDLYPNVRLIHLLQDEALAPSKEQLPCHIEAIFEQLETFRHRHQIDYDLIHSHYWISAAVGTLAQNRWRCPHLTMFHTLGAVKNLVTDNGKEPIRRIAHERWLAKVVDGIVAPSALEQRNLLCHYHPKPEVVHTIPCGVNLDQFQPMDQKAARKKLNMLPDVQIALYVGRFAHVKGLDNLMKALAILKNSRPDLHLVVVGGDGPEAESTRRLINYVRRQHLEKRVVFAGRIDQQELPIYYNAADFLVLPSLYESFGLVVLEALACDTPVVAAAVGAVDTILKEGVNGIIVETPDEEGLAQAITRILDAPPKSRGSIRTTVTAFDWKHITASITKTYNFLLNAQKRTRITRSGAAQRIRSK